MTSIERHNEQQPAPSYLTVSSLRAELPCVSSEVTNADTFCWRLIIWAIGISIVVLTAIQPRRFIVGEIDAVKVSPLAQSVSIGLTILFLLIAFFAMTILVLKKNDRSDRLKVKIYCFLFILLSLLPTISDFIRGVPIKGLSLALVTIAMYLTSYFLAAPSVTWWVREVRIMMLILFIYGSLVSSLVFPEWAWSLGYDVESSTSLFSMRLFGTVNHPNSLAPIAVFYFLLGLFPGTRLKGEFLHTIATILVFLFAQSKTIWGVTAFLYGIHLLMMYFKMSKKNKLWFLTISVPCLSAIFVFLSYSSSTNRFFSDLMLDSQVSTFTGRLAIWLLAIEMWLASPWIGQGFGAWSTQASMLDKVSSLGFSATHAHNQILQVLSQSGLVGLGVFIMFMVSYFKTMNKMPEHIRSIIIWLSALFILHGSTEVVIQYNLGSGSTLTTWVLISLVMIIGKRQVYSKIN